MKLKSIIVAVFLIADILFCQSPLFNNMPANGVLGQPNFTSNQSGTSASNLKSPSGVAVDPLTGKLFVVDRYNNRVLRWRSSDKLRNGSEAEAVFGQPDFNTVTGGLAADKFNDPLRAFVDSTGTLWVSDYLNNRVLRFDNASSRPSGASADGVLGQPDFTTKNSGAYVNRMYGPVGVFVDGGGRLWVADRLNHRVLRYDNAKTKSNGASANGVLGQPRFLNRFKRYLCSKNEPSDGGLC